MKPIFFTLEELAIAYHKTYPWLAIDELKHGTRLAHIYQHKPVVSQGFADVAKVAYTASSGGSMDSYFAGIAESLINSLNPNRVYYLPDYLPKEEKLQSLTTLEEVAYKMIGWHRYLTICERDDGMRFAYISKYQPTYIGRSAAGFNHYWEHMVPYVEATRIGMAQSLLYSLNPAECYDLYEYRPKE